MGACFGGEGGGPATVGCGRGVAEYEVDVCKHFARLAPLGVLTDDRALHALPARRAHDEEAADGDGSIASSRAERSIGTAV